MIALRPYQEAAIAASERALAEGVRRQVWSLPTGSGKTIAAASLARRRGGRTLWIAHRDELVRQAAEAFARVWPEAPVGVVQAGRDEPDRHVVVASVQSLRGRRLARWAPDAFATVVVDEAHHAPAPGYQRVLRRLRPGLLLGVTATPFRGDKLALSAAFDRVVYAYGIRDAIRDGWLADIRAYRVRGPADLDAVASRAGDFAEGDLARAVDSPERNALVVGACLQHAAGRRAIVFAVGVAHAQRLAAAFRDAGVAAEAVWGGMPLEERRAALGRFARGETLVLTNAQLLTEGFDEPRIEAVILARPTKSLALYTQMVGRGTRPAPGKADVVLVDVADNTRRHRLVTVADLIGLRRDPAPGESVLARMERERAMGAQAERWLARLAPGRVAAEEVPDLFEDLACGPAPSLDWRDVLAEIDDVRADPEALRDALRAAAYRLQGPLQPATDAQVRRLAEWGWPPDEAARLPKWAASWAIDRHRAIAAAWAADRARRWAALLGCDPAETRQAVAQELWHLVPATDAQRRYLRRLGTPPELVEVLSRGEAHWLIDQTLAAARAREATAR